MNKASARTVAKLLLGVFLIAFITMWAYHPTTKNLFVWDTKAYLYVREFWVSKLNPYHIIWMFLSLEFSNWHPLTWLSWAIDYQLYGGLVPWGYHFSNNILHAINSILVFVLTLVVFGLNSPEAKGYPIRADNNALIAAFLAALLFAVHPQHVESVAWVAERKDLLCQLFLLLSLLAYVKYVTCLENVKTRWFRITLGLFLLAVLSKPMAVTFPVVLLLIDAYPLRRTRLVAAINQSTRQYPLFKLLREKVPFFLLSILLAFATLFAQQEAMAKISFDLRALNAFNSIIFYLNQLFIPLNFAPQYPYFVDVGEKITWSAFVPLLSVLGLTLASLFAWTRGRHQWLIAWLFYLVTLSPVLGLIQVGQQGAADRYAYFPTLPVYLLLGAGILVVLNRTTAIRRLAVFLAVLAVVFLLTSKTRQQIEVWENDQTLWSYTIMFYPENNLAQLNLGVFYLNDKNYEKAAFHFEKAGNLRPNEAHTFAWRAVTNLHLGRYEEAIIFLVKLGSASESKPELKADQYCIQYNIGWSYAQLGMFAESSELLNRVDPKSALGHDASIWLNWLENAKQAKYITATTENLPKFCNKPLPSM